MQQKGQVDMVKHMFNHDQGLKTEKLEILMLV